MYIITIAIKLTLFLCVYLCHSLISFKIDTYLQISGYLFKKYFHNSIYSILSINYIPIKDIYDKEYFGNCSQA